jgi:lipopolysaccharide transport system ATP-binding protein
MAMQGTNVIQAHDLGKCYKIYDNPKARLKQALWRRNKQYYREFWALRNVSFEVKRGESLGIIGRNGSGKSTLLQLICGTLTATEGNLSTQGRIAALLELGSGFNPEFTGLENVYLNASLLGLRKEETDAKLEQILGFADIGDFIDQPVKSYSSGMTVRLAFAVIAHVNPDILVVDEALAVGDAIFVQRCMRFIRRMREERCLLFVSHDAEAVKSLCSHALWLSEGTTQSYGSCKEVTLDYLRYCQATSYGEEFVVTTTNSVPQEISPARRAGSQSNELPEIHEAEDRGVIFTYTDNLSDSDGWKTGNAELIEITIRQINGNEANSPLRGGEKVEICVLAKAIKSLKNPVLGFIVKDRLGQGIFGENTLTAKHTSRDQDCEPGCLIAGTFQLWFPLLPTGAYTLTAAIATGDEASNTQHHWAENAAIINVSASKIRYGLAGAFITDISLSMTNPHKDCDGDLGT